MTQTPRDPFTDVDGAWRSCFLLAWEAFQARSIPIGAVLVDAHGELVRCGRTLEPCFLCTAALRHSHVGVVRFAAPDPMWHGVDRLPEISPQIARRWTRRERPLGGHLQTWAALLPLVSAVERGVGSVQQSHAGTMPELLSLARSWAGATADRLRTLDLDSALAASWRDVAARRI